MPKFEFRSPYIAFEQYIVEADSKEEAEDFLNGDSIHYYTEDQSNFDTMSIQDYFELELKKSIPDYPKFEFVDELDE